MRFFNIREQVVSLVMPDGKTAMTFHFKQNLADAMLQELVITDPHGGPTAFLTFDKAGAMREAHWEGLDGISAGDPDAAQLDQQQAQELGLKPGQKSVDGTGRLIQAPGAKTPGNDVPTPGDVVVGLDADTGLPVTAEEKMRRDNSGDPVKLVQDGAAASLPGEARSPDVALDQPFVEAAPATAPKTPEIMQARPPRTR